MAARNETVVAFLESDPLVELVERGDRDGSIRGHALEDVSPREEYRVLRKALKQPQCRLRLLFGSLTVGSLQAVGLRRAHVLHIAAHGSVDGLIGEQVDRVGFGRRLDVKTIVDNLGGEVKVIVLGACCSLELGNALARSGIPHVVATRWEVASNVMDHWSHSFYRALAQRCSIARAFDLANSAVAVELGEQLRAAHPGEDGDGEVVERGVSVTDPSVTRSLPFVLLPEDDAHMDPLPVFDAGGEGGGGEEEEEGVESELEEELLEKKDGWQVPCDEPDIEVARRRLGDAVPREVARQLEEAHVLLKLSDLGDRVVRLLGEPGSGKNTICRRVAAYLLKHGARMGFPDGAVVVTLDQGFKDEGEGGGGEGEDPGAKVEVWKQVAASMCLASDDKDLRFESSDALLGYLSTKKMVLFFTQTLQYLPQPPKRPARVPIKPKPPVSPPPAPEPAEKVKVGGKSRLGRSRKVKQSGFGFKSLESKLGALTKKRKEERVRREEDCDPTEVLKEERPMARAVSDQTAAVSKHSPLHEMREAWPLEVWIGECLRACRGCKVVLAESISERHLEVVNDVYYDESSLTTTQVQQRNRARKAYPLPPLAHCIESISSVGTLGIRRWARPCLAPLFRSSFPTLPFTSPAPDPKIAPLSDIARSIKGHVGTLSLVRARTARPSRHEFEEAFAEIFDAFHELRTCFPKVSSYTRFQEELARTPVPHTPSHPHPPRDAWRDPLEGIGADPSGRHLWVEMATHLYQHPHDPELRVPWPLASRVFLDHVVQVIPEAERRVNFRLAPHVASFFRRSCVSGLGLDPSDVPEVLDARFVLRLWQQWLRPGLATMRSIAPLWTNYDPPIFRPFLTRDSAKEVLRGSPPGTFIVRLTASKHAGSLAITSQQHTGINNARIFVFAYDPERLIARGIPVPDSFPASGSIATVLQPVPHTIEAIERGATLAFQIVLKKTGAYWDTDLQRLLVATDSYNQVPSLDKSEPVSLRRLFGEE